VGILRNIASWFSNSPAQDSFEKGRDQWKGSVEYTEKRHAWFSRENRCSGSGQAPVTGSVRVVEPPYETKRLNKRGLCQECSGDFSVSKASKVASHKARS
jgi:hypothetical protein